MEKKRLPFETNKEKIWMEELTSKGKYKVNVGNHLHANMISKQATGEQSRVQMQAIRKAFEIKMSATNNTDYT